MKALYCLWADYDMIDKAIDAGIDTLIVANQNLEPWEDEIYIHWGTYKECTETAERYRERVKLVFCPLYFPFLHDLPEPWSLVEKDGTIRRRTPCPSSYVLLECRMLGVLDFCYKHGIREVIFDPEPYLHKKYDSIQEWNNHVYGPAKRCYCPKCKGLSTNAQWRTFQENMKSLYRYSGIKTRGHLLLNHPWTLDRYDEPGCWLESTYKGLGVREQFKLMWRTLYSRVKYGRFTNYYAGAWIEYFKTDDDFIRYLKRIKHNPLFKGYWIYSQVRMTKNDRHVEEGYLNDTKVTDSFFEKLKGLNYG